jgi:hypothetical protein
MMKVDGDGADLTAAGLTKAVLEAAIAPSAETSAGGAGEALIEGALAVGVVSAKGVSAVEVARLKAVLEAGGADLIAEALGAAMREGSAVVAKVASADGAALAALIRRRCLLGLISMPTGFWSRKKRRAAHGS